MIQPNFFPTQADFRKWLTNNHDRQTELWVGYYKKATKIASIDWPQSVDEALCFGWIDGLRKSIDEKRYMIRFTPRKPKSHWSHVNLKRVPELINAGLMRPSGLVAYERRDASRSGKAAHEQKEVDLSKQFEKIFKENSKAWAFFSQLPPGYRKQTSWWVMSAKRKDTQLRRLGNLIKHSESGEKIPQLVKYQKKK